MLLSKNRVANWHTPPAFVFNPDSRGREYARACSREYAAYCLRDNTPQGPGPNEERAKAYLEICERLKSQYPTARERGIALPDNS